ncbi:hypothetical protein M427DRAFT_30551 [Gonapodya prolifera JEL478]|uniref:Ras GEF n=1 Tax=Gonapodya prolifera (strain JEL478) TaxID=1344416 RepID=A0A139AKY2_GONPJ|nr:hypothetical protein M427DRAFT_30551 [Gonapodya prolifera JEL478]|eukprot:KXS17430.1 hypothetical protein M427DRAFT_30551 [Gonapodya prolifera JEL478]
MAWDSPAERRQKAPNIVAMTGQFNKLALWVAAEILESTNVKRRMARISHFIAIAKQCVELNDFHSAKAIVSGLQSTPVWRLDKTWSGIARKDKSTFDKMCEMLAPDSNYESLRKELRKAAKQAHIPFLGVWLLDLIYLNEARKKERAERPGSAHESERDAQIATTIDEILKSAENAKFDYDPIPALQNLLTSDKYIEELRAMHEDTFYAMSYQLEPKETPGSSPSRAPANESGEQDGGGDEKKRIRVGRTTSHQAMTPSSTNVFSSSGSTGAQEKQAPVDLLTPDSDLVSHSPQWSSSSSAGGDNTNKAEDVAVIGGQGGAVPLPAPTDSVSVPAPMLPEHKSRTVTGYLSMVVRSPAKGGNVGRDVVLDQRKWKTVSAATNKKQKGAAYATLEDEVTDDMKFLDMVLGGDVVVPEVGGGTREGGMQAHGKEKSSSSKGSARKIGGVRSRKSTDEESASGVDVRETNGAGERRGSVAGPSPVQAIMSDNENSRGATASTANESQGSFKMPNPSPVPPPPSAGTGTVALTISTYGNEMGVPDGHSRDSSMLATPSTIATTSSEQSGGSRSVASPESNLSAAMDSPGSTEGEPGSATYNSHNRVASNVSTSVRSEKPTLQGTVTKKDELDVEGRRAANRSWTKVALVLRGTSLLMFHYRKKLHKASGSDETSSAVLDLKRPIQIIDLSSTSSIEIPCDYKKRKNVFRVKPAGKAQVLFQVDDSKDLDRWMQAIREKIETLKAPTELPPENLIQFHDQ